MLTGSDLSLSVSASSAYPPLRYQWRRDGVDLPGATNDVLAITNVQSPDTILFSVLVSDRVDSVQSAVAAVSLSDALVSVRTGVVSSIGTTWGLVSGSFNSHGSLASAYFDYGPSLAYGSTTLPLKDVLEGNRVSLTNLLLNLVADTEYHVRLVVQTSAGTYYGTDQEFRTINGSLSDTKVLTWGIIDDGQTNVPAAALSGVEAIAGGWAHTVALKSDGSVLAWGQNDHGQTDVPAAAQSGVVAIAAGDYHTVALKDRRAHV